LEYFSNHRIMKKIFWFILAHSISILSISAKQIDEKTAQIVGNNFLKHKTGKDSEMELTYISKSKTGNQNIYFYIFNTKTNDFIIVAGDDIVLPILGYSHEGIFDPHNIPLNTLKWFEMYKNQIRYAIDNDLEASPQILLEWKNLIDNKTQTFSAKINIGVNPLIQTKWDQSPYYNAFCPIDNQYNQRTVAGCVATAMAQIMKYWNYPPTGSGFHSYNHSKFGTLSANFGSTTYQWGSMPAKLTGTNNAVATLMYHCGVSVDMNYGVSAEGGSSAYTLDVVESLKKYFGYPSSVQGKYRSNYTELQWKNLLKSELDAKRPIQYAGTGSGGGHSFVCDGYDNFDFFHFNWGWGGSSDGYFTVNALNPGSLGAGGGTGGFNSNQRAIIGIQAPTGTQAIGMGLNANITTTPNPLYYGNAFKVTTNIVNNGNTNFSGDYCAAIFDDDYNFIDYVEIKTGNSLQSGYTYSNNLVFSSEGNFGILPGNYFVGIFYRPTGGNWVIVSNNGNYSNLTKLEVLNPNDIELNSAMALTPGTTFTQGQPASVKFNIINDGKSTFFGQYRVNLYDLEGSFVQTINTINENNGLAPGFTYLSPFITLSSTSITAEPGTYLLAVVHKPNGSSNWILTGSTYFQNPVKITVKQPEIQPDAYESNNSASKAFPLAVTFTTYNATKNTVGSNCHTGNDYDYYKISLPAGFTYKISPRLHDSYNSGNGIEYSLDALFSYSKDGLNWSDAFDDITGDTITVLGGNTIYFFVSPYFTGETGTYLLDIGINRSLTTDRNEEIELSHQIRVFPNPTYGEINIDLTNFQKSVLGIKILDLHGKTVQTIPNLYQNKFTSFSLESLPRGIYFIQFKTSDFLISKKIILQ